jgi:SAM-dependent methyltransferase
VEAPPKLAGRLAASVSRASRRRKLELFLAALHPGPGTSVIDVGVSDVGYGESPGHAATANFFEAYYPWPERITAVGVTQLSRFRQAFPAVTAVTADGRDLPFGDEAFDIGFSNAVLEHLPSQVDQRRFVDELCRVARRVFVTTPNRWFPLEVHTLVPLVHWLPDDARDMILSAIGKGEHAGLRLLGPADLRDLFPGPVQVRNLGLTLVACTEAPA